MPRNGQAHHNAKLTPDQVCELRRLHYDIGLCKTCAAYLVGVNRQTAWDAITYKTWAHVLDAPATTEK